MNHHQHPPRSHHQAQHHHNHHQQQHHRREQPPPNEEHSVKSTESVSDEDGEKFPVGEETSTYCMSQHLWFALLCLGCVGTTIGLSIVAANQAKAQPAENFELRVSGGGGLLGELIFRFFVWVLIVFSLFAHIHSFKIHYNVV
jgi:hypothetical protein